MYLIDEEILGHTVISPKMIQSYRLIAGGEKQWVAKITGIDKKFGFAREFVNREEDFFNKEMKITFYYLWPGIIYQYKNIYVDKESTGIKYASGYIAINEQHDKLISLEENEVRKLLGMPVKDWVVQEITYARDDLPF